MVGKGAWPSYEICVYHSEPTHRISTNTISLILFKMGLMLILMYVAISPTRIKKEEDVV